MRPYLKGQVEEKEKNVKEKKGREKRMLGPFILSASTPFPLLSVLSHLSLDSTQEREVHGTYK